MRKLRFLLFALVLLPLAANADKHGASIKVVNQSKWDIHHLYLSPADDHRWGPDQLGKAVIASGETFTLTNIACNDYDIRIVDEDGDECVVEAVNMCGDKTVWKITDKILLACENE